MIGIPAKILTIIAQAGLVVLAVFIFSYFDPFNIFNSKKLTMKDTPVIVNSIKSIGILITAEYYGEVIKSTGEPLQLFVDSMRAVKENSLFELEATIRRVTRLDYRLDSTRKEIQGKSRYASEFKNRHGIFRDLDNATYNDFLTIVRDHAGTDEAGMLYAYYTGNELFPDTPGRPSFRDHVSAYGEKTNQLSKKDIRDTERDGLVLLGRGSVKAGIDLSNFDERHFQYIPSRNLVRLLSHRTSIVAASINPWFIPQKKIKGFDYIFVGSSLEKNPDSRKSVKIIQNLKSACLESLKADAKEAGIIGRARENAEVTLGHFLSLLMGKTIQVEIFEHPLDAALHDLLKDGVVNTYTLTEVDSLVDQYILTEYSRTYEFVRRVEDSLMRKSFRSSPWKNANQNLEALTYYYRISEDSFYTKKEKLEVMRLLTASFERKTALKSFLYASAAAASGPAGRLAKVSIPDSVQLRAAFNSRQDHFDKLSTCLAGLKTSFRSAEIAVINSTIADLLEKNNLRDAYMYQQRKLELATDEQRENLNWRFVYFFVAAAEHRDSALLSTEFSKFGTEPTKLDYFYYLYQKGHLDKAQNGKPDLEGLLKNHPEWVKAVKEDYQMRRKQVDDLLNNRSVKKDTAVVKSLH